MEMDSGEERRGEERSIYYWAFFLVRGRMDN
jgi:hypothetical protein